MGFSILWIMVYHSGMSFSFLPLFAEAANDFRASGYGGVDVFLFLSGFGLHRALSKSPGQLAFYRRRLTRVLPAYLPVLAVWLLWKLPGVPCASWPRVILGNLTGTAFWLSSSPAFNWYMLALFSFYFIAPFFFKVMDRPGGTLGILAATLVLDACFYGHYVMIAVTRFTVFAMGMALGRWTAGGGKPGRGLEPAVCVLGLFSYWLLHIFRVSLPGGLLWNGGFYWYPFILAAPALILLLCRLFSWMERRTPHVLRLFETAGECSLEIYLIHVVVFERLSGVRNGMWPMIFAAMLLFGYVYHRAVEKVLAWRPFRPAEPGKPARRNTETRKVYIEFLRIAAAFLVIVNHTNSRIFLRLSPSPTWLCSLTYFFVCKTAVPLFLFIMGALLLLLPILQRLVKALSKRQLEYLLFLSLGVLGTAPLVTIFFPDLRLSGNFTAGLVGPYIGQVLLGYYLERYLTVNKRSFWFCLCGFVFSIVSQTAGTFLLYRRDPSSYLALDNRTLLTITASAACLYVCVKYVFTAYPPPLFLERAILRLGGLTFGVYLLSDMVLIQSAPVHGALSGHMHPLCAMVLWELFIFTASALAAAGLRLVPPLRKYL